MLRRSNSRRASAAVEAAVCLPVIVLILAASVEICGGMYQHYEIHAATFELSKLALGRSTTSNDVQAAAADLLPQLGFEDYSITIDVEPRTTNTSSVESTSATTFSIPKTGTTTAGLDELPRGTVLRLTVTAQRPTGTNGGLFQKFLQSTIQSDCVFVKEF